MENILDSAQAVKLLGVRPTISKRFQNFHNFSLLYNMK